MRRWRFSIVNRLAVWGIKLCRVRHGPRAAFFLPVAAGNLEGSTCKLHHPKDVHASALIIFFADIPRAA